MTRDKELLFPYSDSATAEVEDICFVLKSTLGLSHDEILPGAQQHSKILSLFSPPPPTLANQKPANPKEMLTNSANCPPPTFHTLVPLNLSF